MRKKYKRSKKRYSKRKSSNRKFAKQITQPRTYKAIGFRM